MLKSVGGDDDCRSSVPDKEGGSRTDLDDEDVLVKCPGG